MMLNHRLNIQYSDLLLIPNLITIFRLLINFPFAYCIIYQYYSLSLVCIFSFWILDLLDGYLSRKLNQTSQLGEILDPFVDKTSFFILAILYYYYLALLKIHLFFFLLVFVKELVFMSFATYGLIKNYEPIPANYNGKISAFLLITFIILSFLQLTFFQNALLLFFNSTLYSIILFYIYFSGKAIIDYYKLFVFRMRY